MKTEVIMKRELFGNEISQKSKSEFFSATDIVKAGNKWRISENKSIFNFTTWLKTKSTQEFIKELESVYGKVIVKSRGKKEYKQTWVHPYLFIDLALAINPKLKIKVYDWLYDYLLKYRNSSGDSYNKMTGAIFKNCTNKENFRNEIKKIANKIKLVCGVTDWQRANENQLKLRDKIHDNISLLSYVMRDNEQILNIAIEKASE